MNLWQRIRRRRPALSELNSEEIIGIKASLERSIDFLSVWMHGFTAVVAVGLIIEYRDPFIKFWHTHDLNYIRNAIGGIMVTIGVAGELLIGFRASSKDGRLRMANSVLALRSADLIASQSERIAALNLQAERERKERIQLEARVGPLRVTEKFDEILKNKPTGRIEIWYLPNKETWSFASRIASALWRAGWTVVAVKEIPPRDQRYGLPFDVGGTLAPIYTLITPIGTIRGLGGSPTAFDALREAITFGIAGLFRGISFDVTEASLSDPNLFILVVGEI